MVNQGRDICAAVSIPVIGDGDTGYGNPANDWTGMPTDFRGNSDGVVRVNPPVSYH